MRRLFKTGRFPVPSDFNGEEYLELHSDVRAEGMDPRRHYARFGASEGRAYKVEERALSDAELIMGRPSMLDASFHQNPETKRPVFSGHMKIWEWVRENASAPGFRVLEIGSRSVISDALWRNVIPDCAYTGFDVRDGRNVDVIGDAHRLSEYFEPGSFDLVMSFAVLEHVAMPWIVAEEISKVLDVGGLVCLETTFSFSEHELPWHFFQFNNRALETLFCPELGFELIDSGLDSPIVGRFSYQAAEYLRGTPVIDLYCHSSLIARKVSPGAVSPSGAAFDWRQVASRIARESMYPAGSGMA